MDSIKSNALYLRLPYIKNNYKEIIKEAEMNELSNRLYILLLLK